MSTAALRLLAPALLLSAAFAQDFNKRETMIPARDGVKLHTVLFTPHNASGPLPIVFERTPYGATDSEKTLAARYPYLAAEAAKLYKDQCAQCHGLPGQEPPISSKMYPDATLMFKGKGVTDDPPQESYWKIRNGIRLTGMPSFKDILNDTQVWQLALLVANADKIPHSAKSVFAPPPPAPAAPATPPAKASGSKK